MTKTPRPTTPSSSAFRLAENRLRADLISLADAFAERSGMADTGIARAVWGPNTDKDWLRRVRRGSSFDAEKAETMEHWLRSGLALKGAEFDRFVKAAREAARLPSRSRQPELA